MTLKELVELYDGEASFEVSRAVTGGKEDVVVFSNTDADAIKDDIMASTVKSYSVGIPSTTRSAAITVMLEAVVAEDSTDEGSAEPDGN